MSGEDVSDSPLDAVESACRLLSERTASEREALISLKQSATSLAAAETGKCFESLFLELLPALDRLRSGELTPDLRDSVIEEILQSCERRGLKPVVNEGAVDLRVHEIMGYVDMPDGIADGCIVDVVRPGYMIAGKLLRPSRVTVARLTTEV